MAQGVSIANHSLNKMVSSSLEYLQGINLEVVFSRVLLNKTKVVAQLGSHSRPKYNTEPNRKRKITNK